MKRFRLKIVFALSVVLATAVVAWAFYATTGTGSGSGGTTGTMTPATISVPATSSGTHAVSFDVQASLSNSAQNSQIKYTVQRKLDSDPFADVPSGDCSGELNHGIASCTDTVTTSGDYTYQVIARYKGWSATSAAAGPVDVTVGGGDTTAPTVSSIDRVGSTPTNAGSVQWTVTFSENVSGVDAADFDLVPSGLGGVPAITNVTGNNAVYTVTASTGTGDGTLGLDLDDDDSVQDAATNKLGGTGADNGDFTGQVYTLDRTAPTVSSIDRVGSTPTNAGSVQWTVTFSENVSGVDAADFDLVPSGLGGSPAITNVTGNNAVYTVTASTGTGDGTLGLDLDDDDSVQDAATNKLGGTGADNGDFTGQVYTIDRTAPTVSSIDRVGSTPTNAGSVQWTVTFSENVSGVDAADFDLVPSGLGGSPAITNVTGNNAVYTVTASTGTGDGTLGLDLDDDDSVQDAATNKLGGTGADNGDFTGQVYTLDRTKPTSAAGDAPNITTETSFTVPYTASDSPNPVTSLTKVELYVDGPSAGTNYVLEATDLTPSASGESFSASATADGTYSFYTRAYDNAGNVEDAPAPLVADDTATKSTPPTFRMATGTYNGNGVDNRTIGGLGFQPDFVIVKNNSSQVAFIRTSTMPTSGNNSKPATGSAGLTTGIRSLTSDGFTLATNANVNASGATYQWMAFKAGAGVLSVGSYTGNNGGRSINGAGFQPEYAAVFPASTTPATQRYAGMSGGFLFFDGVGTSQRITSLDADGFSVHSSHNSTGTVYHYVMFNEVPGTIEQGLYTGTGSAQSINAGFQPDYVMIRGDANVIGHHRPASLGGTSSQFFNAAGNTTSGITSLNPTGFSVGTDSSVNSSGPTYYYLALKNTAGGSSQFQTLSGTNAGDSWVNQASTGANLGGDSVLKVTSKSGSSNTRAFVQFGLPSAPGGFTFKHSGMYLRDTSAASGRVIQAFRVGACAVGTAPPCVSPWTEGGITWANQPPADGAAATANTVSADGYLGWEVTSLVSAMYSGTNRGFFLRDQTENDTSGQEQQFTSEEGSSDQIPRLDVTFGN